MRPLVFRVKAIESWQLKGTSISLFLSITSTTTVTCFYLEVQEEKSGCVKGVRSHDVICSKSSKKTWHDILRWKEQWIAMMYQSAQLMWKVTSQIFLHSRKLLEIYLHLFCRSIYWVGIHQHEAGLHQQGNEVNIRFPVCKQTIEKQQFQPGSSLFQLTSLLTSPHWPIFPGCWAE